MEQSGKTRGRQAGIQPEHWPELQRMERGGATIREMQAWLLEQGVKVGTSSVFRALDRIRAAAPLPAVPKPTPELEPQTDEDELKVMRRLAREDMKGGDWKQRHSALRCLLAVRAEERVNRGQQPPAGEGEAQPATPATVTAPVFGVKPHACA